MVGNNESSIAGQIVGVGPGIFMDASVTINILADVTLLKVPGNLNDGWHVERYLIAKES